MQIKMYLKIFIFCSVGYGLIMGLLHGPQAGIESGLIFGFFMSLILGTLQIFFTSKGKKRGFKPFSVYQTKEIDISLSIEEAFDKCIESLEKVKKCKVVEKNFADGKITAKTGTTWKTFGENIEVRLIKTGTNSTNIQINSKPAVSTTLVDFGKNIQNIESIVNHLKVYLIV